MSNSKAAATWHGRPAAVLTLHNEAGDYTLGTDLSMADTLRLLRAALDDVEARIL